MSNDDSSPTEGRSFSDRALDWLGGAFATFLVGLALFYIKSESPQLKYEVFPPSSYVSEQTERTIYTVQVANEGDAAAKQVSAEFDFPNGTIVQDSRVKASPAGIEYNPVDTSASSVREFIFPYLNPGENVKFSFLLSGNINSADVTVRGPGFAATERNTQEESLNIFSDAPLILVLIIISMMTIMIGLLITMNQITKREIVEISEAKRGGGEDISD